MHRKYNKFLIVTSLVVFVLAMYSYFYKDMQSEAAGTQGALASSLTTNLVNKTTAGKASDDTAFLNQLVSLKKIKVDASIFSSQSFKFLADNNIQLDQAPYGRNNPFSPVDGNPVNTTPDFSLETKAATLITNKSANLNGSLEGVSSNNIYFEYGTTEKLGKTTPRVSPSLAGEFSSTLNSLTSKTTYYFRTAANIGGSISYGEIMSFNTN